MSKRLIIIGAGISGLTSGVYCRRSGIDTTIFERAGNPGGVSTSWKRKGYTFEGGIHWLIGSIPSNPLNDIWTETGALNADTHIFYKDPVYSLMENGRPVLDIFRDSGELRKAFIKAAPEDRFRIHLLCFHLWCFKSFHPPILDLPGLKVKGKHPFRIMEFVRMLPAVLLTPFLMMISAGAYCRRFRNRELRELMTSVIHPSQNALSLIYTLATFCYGDSGYPSGGSRIMAQKMADTFTRLGGNIFYGKTVERIAYENGKVRGVYVDGSLVEADAVIISQDARKAIDKLFDEPLQDKWARTMRKTLETEQCIFIALGVKARLGAYPDSMVFSLEKPFEAGGARFPIIRINNYSFEKDYAPEGGTVLTCLLSNPTWEFWKQAKDNGCYAQSKKELLERFITLVETLIPETRNAVEVTDIATPLTYERYCDTHHGSWMTMWRPWSFTSVAPIRYKRIKGLYFTGQRTSFSGGLPVAATSGRNTAQAVCKDLKQVFISK